MKLLNGRAVFQTLTLDKDVRLTSGTEARRYETRDYVASHPCGRRSRRLSVDNGALAARVRVT
jgi:hypothetical protein